MRIAGCHLFPVIGIYFINLFALLCELVQVKAQSEDADELVFGITCVAGGIDRTKPPLLLTVIQHITSKIF